MIAARDVLGAALGVAMVAVACGGGKATETVTQTVPPTDPVTRAPDTLPVVDSGVAPVVVDSGKADSGACPPASIDTTAIAAMHPPHVHPGMCTSAAQLDETVTRCVHGVGSCSDWLADTANYECHECLFSDTADTVWGPVVYFQSKRSMYNRGGAASLSGASAACADAVHRADLCVRLACTCASTSGTCEARAATGACKALGDARDAACAADKDIVAGLDPSTGSAFYALFCP